MAATIISAFLFCLVVILPANLPCKAEPEPKPNVIRPFWRRPTNKPKPTLLPPKSKDPEFYRKLREEIPPKIVTAKKLITKLWRIRPGGKRSIPNITLEDFVFVLDGSGSVGNCEFGNAKKALRNMLEFEQKGVHPKYAMVTFASNARKDFGFLPPQDAQKKIDRVTFPNGWTNTQSGLSKAFEILRKGNRGFSADKFVLLFTDGHSNIKKKKTIPNAEKLKKSGVKILVIAVGNRHMSGIDEMAHIATFPPADNLFRVETFGGLLDVVNLAIKQVNSGKYKIMDKYKSPCMG